MVTRLLWFVDHSLTNLLIAVIALGIAGYELVKDILEDAIEAKSAHGVVLLALMHGIKALHGLSDSHRKFRGQGPGAVQDPHIEPR